MPDRVNLHPRRSGHHPPVVDPYPALTAWRRRDGDKPAGRWIRDALWLAATWEAAASEVSDSRERRRACHREAIAVILGAEAANRITRATWDRYIERIAELVRRSAA